MRDISKSAVKRENWLLTFNDMMTLIFTFFVLILSFSNMQSNEILSAADSFNRALSSGKAEGVFRSAISPIISPYRDKDIEIEKQKKALLNHDEGKAGKLKSMMLGIVGGEQRATVDHIGNDITVSMEESTLFKPDSYVLHSHGEQILTNMADKVRDDKVDIRIECHDGNKRSGAISRESVHASLRPSANMDVNMSMLRAGTITRYLIEQGRLQPQRLSAMGYEALKDKTKHRIEIVFRS